MNSVWAAPAAGAGVGSPAGVVGSDASGLVVVVLGADGLPDALRVTGPLPAPGTGMSVGAAVGAAFAAAHRAHVAATAAEVGQAVRRWASIRHERQIAGVGLPGRGGPAVSAVAAVDRAQSLWATVRVGSPMCGVGRSAHGAVTMTLARPAAVSCVVELRWVAGACPAVVTGALGEALTDARRHLAAAVPSPADEAAGLVAALIAELEETTRRAAPPQLAARRERAGEVGFADPAGGIRGRW